MDAMQQCSNAAMQQCTRRAYWRVERCGDHEASAGTRSPTPSALPLDPYVETISRPFSNLELDRPLCFLLHDSRTTGNGLPAADVASLQPHEVACAQFAVDCHIEHGSIAAAQAARVRNECKNSWPAATTRLLSSLRSRRRPSCPVIPLCTGDCRRKASENILRALPLLFDVAKPSAADSGDNRPGGGGADQPLKENPR
jgi:hypothetical protein